jgi:hypothetical protein
MEATANITESISFSSIDTKRLPGIMILFEDTSENAYYPLYVSLEKDSDFSNTYTGLTVEAITSQYVKLSSDVSGTVYYLESGTSTVPSEYKIVSNGKSTTISANGMVTIPISGFNDYMIVYLDGYTPFSIDLREEYDSSSSGSDGSTVRGTGFNECRIDLMGNKLIVIPKVSGTVSVTAPYFSFSTTAEVTAGVESQISLAGLGLDQLFGGGILGTALGGLFPNGITIYVQLTSGDDVYQRVEQTINLGNMPSLPNYPNLPNFPN